MVGLRRPPRVPPSGEDKDAEARHLCLEPLVHLDMWVGMWVCPMGGCGLAKREIRYVPGVGHCTCSPAIR